MGPKAKRKTVDYDKTLVQEDQESEQDQELMNLMNKLQKKKAAASKSSKAKPKPPSKRSTKETGFIYTLKDYQEQFKRTIAQTEKELTIISVDGEIKYLKNRSWLTFTILLDESEICKDLAEGIETIHSFLDEILKVTEETKAVIQGYNTNLSSLEAIWESDIVPFVAEWKSNCNRVSRSQVRKVQKLFDTRLLKDIELEQ